MIEKTPLDHPARKDRIYSKCGEFKQASEFHCYKQKNSYGGFQACPDYFERVISYLQTEKENL